MDHGSGRDEVPTIRLHDFRDTRPLRCLSQRSGARPRLVWDDVLLDMYQPRHQKPNPPMVLLPMSLGFSKKGMR